MTFKYILDEHGNPTPCEDIYQWRQYLDRHRIIARDEIGPLHVSTVFLGIDHNLGFDGDRRPVLFETMIFHGDNCDLYQVRYHTLSAARAGHEDAIAWARHYIRAYEPSKS